MESEIKVKCITYNVGDKSADQVKPNQMFEFLEREQNDFVFIGLQELVNDESWTELIKNRFKKHDYVLFKVRNIWAIWLYALVKRKHLKSMTNIESEITASGYAGVLGNKGGVSIRLKFQAINICVVNAHFTAHEESYKDRLNDYLDIISNQSFRDEEVENVLDHDIVIWMGDLNFRLEGPTKQDVERRIGANDLKSLWQYDQLVRAIKEHSIFQDFKEGPLNFKPTFKFDEDCDVYDTSKKQRKPAWTDRILCMSHQDASCLANLDSVLLLEYTSCELDRGSDHRPVTAVFKVTFKESNFADGVELPVEFDKITGDWNGQKDELVQYKIRLYPSFTNTDTNKDKTVLDGIGSIVPTSATAGNDLQDGNCLPTSPRKNNDADNSAPLFKIDTWDWIGLMSADWTHLQSEFITYSYMQGNAEPNDTNENKCKNATSTEALGTLLYSATNISRTVALGGRNLNPTNNKMASSPREPDLVAEVEFAKKYLQDIKPKQALQLVYFSRFKNCIQGYSDVFYSK